MSNTKLDPKKVISTIGLLKVRIDERFPNSSLGRVCRDLRDVSRNADRKAEEIRQPLMGYRLIVMAFVAAVLGFSFMGLGRVNFDLNTIDLAGVLGVLDALFNIVFLVGGAIFFLVSVENRVKRKKVIKAVNELRCLAHVIDSHQLTKDPCYIARKVIRTSHSPERTMDSFELGRYLDYCSEMLSLTSKVAFLYVQNYNDAVATKAVKDLEDLTNGLSSKIWQKIMTIQKDAEKELIL